MQLRPSILLPLILVVFSCQKAVVKEPDSFNAQLVSHEEEAPVAWKPGDFDRSAIQKKLEDKRKAGEPWIAHVLVPLCDNDNQGIVPVNSSLGNGQNPRSNLYWGAGYGLRTHFKRSADWITIPTQAPTESHILDQVAFEKKFPNGTRVILIMQAYDGAYMKTCLEDYFDYLAGNKQGKIQLESGEWLAGGQNADLIAINGHNGLMDVDVQIPTNTDGLQKDAVAIACISHDYFREPLASTGGYPLLCTTGLMAPEAYVIRAILDAWGAGKAPAEIRTAAGAAYNKYQKCGIKGATNLFRTGW